MIENSRKNYEVKDLEVGVEKVLLGEMKRRMNPPVAKIAEEEMALEGAEDSEEEKISILLLATDVESRDTKHLNVQKSIILEKEVKPERRSHRQMRHRLLARM